MLGSRAIFPRAPDILFRQIAISDDHGCGIRFDDGGIVCWGANRLGQSVTVLPTGYFVPHLIVT